jgi:hypothetical protein
MNIAEILKNAPEGTKLYSPIYGNVELLNISNESEYPIKAKICDNQVYVSFSKEGKFNIEHLDSECVLFPSKENRDWNTFKVEKYYEFKPFDKVLVRDTDDEPWRCNIYSHKESGAVFPYKCIYAGYKQCIPFNCYKHLIGTTTSPDCILSSIK